MDHNPENVQSLQIHEIMSWGINAPGKTAVKVALPTLQRGYVWKAEQVEGLWDSLVRQLPIGSFLVTAYETALVSQKKAEKLSAAPPEYLLLDGQQRSTAIALALADPWGDKAPEYRMALWVDLSRPASHYRDRCYMFRLVTSSHPWGYQWNSEDRLDSEDRRKALGEFIKALRRHKNLEAPNAPLPPEAKYPGLRVAHSWPWDAHCPVPFAFLWSASVDGQGCFKRNWRDNLLASIESVGFWQSGSMPTKHIKTCWKDHLIKIISDGQSEEFKRLELLAATLPQVYKTLIPVSVLPKTQTDLAGQLQELHNKLSGPNMPASEEILPQDTIEALFVRINSSGTTLGGEELIYSTFKSIWPDSEELVEKIGLNSFIRPARLVALTGRLVLSLQEEEKERNNQRQNRQERREGLNFTPALTVDRFRSLIRDTNDTYRNSLSEFIENKAEHLFTKAREFLAGTIHREKGHEEKLPDRIMARVILDNEKDYRLGSLLMEDIAKTQPDIYFFFLRWFLCNSQGIENRQEKTRKKILGALTSIVFFSSKPETLARRLWPYRDQDWWLHLKEVMSLDKNGQMVMLPPPSPGELGECLSSCLPAPVGNKKIKWNDWTWGCLDETYPRGTQSEYARLCKRRLKPRRPEEAEAIEERLEERLVDLAWREFLKNLWNERRLVLFAQRFWLDKFFPGYNPAAPDQIEDSDRPYDWDHIFPQSYIDRAQNILSLWKDDWPHTIGNLRAWPMELNRGDGNIPPADKLGQKTVLMWPRVKKKIAESPFWHPLFI